MRRAGGTLTFTPPTSGEGCDQGGPRRNTRDARPEGIATDRRGMSVMFTLAFENQHRGIRQGENIVPNARTYGQFYVRAMLGDVPPC